VEVFHFTNIQNIPGICEARALLCDGRRPGAIRNVDVNAVEARRRRQVPIAPGGVLGDYVPFYFAPRSPMLYRVITGWNVTLGRTRQSEIAFFILDLDDHPNGNVCGQPSIVSNGHPLSGYAQFSTATSENVEACVDWEVMRNDQWNNTDDDPTRMHRRQAELLVHDHVPIDESGIAIAVLTDEARNYLQKSLSDRKVPVEVAVNENLFYPGYR
jgi:hypothetical protein